MFNSPGSAKLCFVKDGKAELCTPLSFFVIFVSFVVSHLFRLGHTQIIFTICTDA